MTQPAISVQPSAVSKWQLALACCLFSLLFLALVACAMAQAYAPHIFYTDLSDAPNTGGENGGGAYVTIDGNFFGASQGSSYVTVGGVKPSVYKQWSQTQIVFQLSSSMPTGLRDIQVMVPGAGASNEIPFTVRSTGHIYCVSTTGSDGSPGTFSGGCWATIRHAAQSMAAGDVTEIENGVAQTGDDPSNNETDLYLWGGSGGIVQNGAPGDSIALVTYPGATATIGCGNYEDVGIGDGSTTSWTHTFTTMTPTATAYSFSGSVKEQDASLMLGFWDPSGSGTLSSTSNYWSGTTASTINYSTKTITLNYNSGSSYPTLAPGAEIFAVPSAVCAQRGIYTANLAYWTIAGLTVIGEGSSGMNLTTSNHLRIVNDTISNPTGASPFDTEVVHSLYTLNSVAYGNTITPQCGSDSLMGNLQAALDPKTASAFYLTTDSSHWDIGWNNVSSPWCSRGFEIHSTSTAYNNGYAMYDLSIHDNVVYNTGGPAIILDGNDPSRVGGVRIYNNVFWRGGTGMDFGWGSFGCIWTNGAGDTNQPLTMSPTQGVTYIYNNTFYDCGRETIDNPQFNTTGSVMNVSYGSPFSAYGLTGSIPALEVYYANNVFYTLNGENWFPTSNQFPLSNAKVVAVNNDFYTTGATSFASACGSACITMTANITSEPSFTTYPAWLSPPAAPTLTLESGGSLPTSTTIGVLVTYLNPNGETTAGALAYVTTPSTCPTSGTCSIQVTSPAAEGNATGYRVYATESTALTLNGALAANNQGNDSQTNQITLSSTTGLLSSGGYVEIDGETIYYAGLSGNNLTYIQRGVGTMVYSAHATGAIVVPFSNFYDQNQGLNNNGGTISLGTNFTISKFTTAGVFPNYTNNALSTSPNFHPVSSSPLIGAGTAPPFPDPYDIEGKPRSSTAPSIGAYEQ